MSMSVCVIVHNHISRTTCLNIIKVFAHVACGSVFLWQHCNM